MDIMSSEEDSEDDGNSVFIVSLLTWLAPEMELMKGQLDAKYSKKVSSKSRRLPTMS